MAAQSGSHCQLIRLAPRHLFIQTAQSRLPFLYSPATHHSLVFQPDHEARVSMAKRKRPPTPSVTTQSAKKARDDRASRRAAAQDSLHEAETARLHAIHDQARRDQMSDSAVLRRGCD